VFLVANDPDAYLPKTVTVAPGRVDVVDSVSESPTRGDDKSDVVGPGGCAAEFWRYPCSETTSDLPRLSGTRKHPVTLPFIDCSMKFEFDEQRELGST
jgi:hypothetical protein